MNLTSHLKSRLQSSERVITSLVNEASKIAEVADALIECFRNHGTLYTCGNGGSAAEALHLTEELIGFYRSNKRAAQRAVCLNADPTAMTCIANDAGFENVFARQCESLITRRDMLLVLSTSGNSETIVKALEVAGRKSATTVGLLGAGGGRSMDLCDHAIVINSEDSAHIQEAHLVIVHLLCEAVEKLIVDA